jgi:spore coat polysaccharide biosynthesis protein SpsF (cytidylyltransferase family)
MSIGALLRVRLSSSRLPGKALAAIAGRPAIAHLIDRIAASRYIDSRRDIVVTTSTDASDDPLVPVVEEAGASLFRGSLDDVVDRTHRALEAFRFDAFMQVDGDDAFADPHYMERTMETLLADPELDVVLCRGLPLGMATKAIRASAVRRIHERYVPGPNGTGAFLYFTESGLCRVGEIGPDSPRHVHDTVRVTLDYPDDLRFFEALVAELGDRPFGTEEIVRLVRRRPELVQINTHLSDAYWERSDEFLVNERLAFRGDDGAVSEIATSSGGWYSRPAAAA